MKNRTKNQQCKIHASPTLPLLVLVLYAELLLITVSIPISLIKRINGELRTFMSYKPFLKKIVSLHLYLGKEML